MSYKKSKLIKQLLNKAHKLLAEWEEKLLISENPNERRRCEIEIQKINQRIEVLNAELEKLHSNLLTDVTLSHLFKELMFYCDRINQRNDFLKSFEEQSDERFQFYLIYYPEHQSAKGLFHRLVKEANKKIPNVQVKHGEVLILDDCELGNLTNDFFERFTKSANKNPKQPWVKGKDSKDLTIKDFLSYVSYDTPPPYIAIQLDIDHDICCPKGIRELIATFIKDFCLGEPLEGSHPRFVFFWAINCPQRSKTLPLLNLFNNPLRKLKKQLKKIPEIRSLGVLTTITYGDIERWFRKHLSTLPDGIIQIILEEYFDPTEATYDMSKVEITLYQFINDYQEMINE